MRRFVLSVLGCVLALASSASLAAPAEAVPGAATVSGVDGVLYDDCVPHPYRYAVDVPADAQSWSLETAVLGPDGRRLDTDQVLSGADPTTGSSAFVLCPPSARPGTYTIRGTFEWQGSDGSWNPSAVTAAHFTLRKPHTRTGLSVSTRRPADGQVVICRVRSLDQRPSGYAANAFAWVHLEKRVAGHWRRIRGGRAMTHVTGRVKVRLRYAGHHRRTWLRAVTEPTALYARSASPAVRLW